MQLVNEMDLDMLFILVRRVYRVQSRAIDGIEVRRSYDRAVLTLI